MTGRASAAAGRARQGRTAPPPAGPPAGAALKGA